MLAIAAGIVVALIASGGTYLVARRSSSGRIDTSEAATLWSESQQMRTELREETVALRAEAVALRSETALARSEAVTLRSEMATLRAEVAMLRAANLRYEAQVIGLRRRLLDVAHYPEELVDADLLRDADRG